MTEPSEARIDRVYRRVHRPWSSLVSRFNWELNLSLMRFSLVEGTVIMISTVLLEIGLWAKPTPGDQVPVSTGVVVLSLALTPLNGLLLDRFLQAKTPRNARPTGRRRALRFLLACIPCVGLFAVPLWRELLQTREGATGTGRPLPALNLAPPATPSRGRAIPWTRLRDSLAPVPVLLTFLQLFLWALWLTGPFSGAGRAEILGACMALHLSLAACAAIFAHEVARSDEPLLAAIRKTAWLLPFLCVLPSTLVLLLFLFGMRSQRFADTLTASAFMRRTGTRSIPLWERNREDLRTFWLRSSPLKRWRMPTGLDPAMEYVPMQDEVRTFYRWKLFLLAGEAGALTWPLFRFSIAGHGVLVCLPILLRICGLLSAAGLLLEVLGWLSHLVRAHGFAKFLDDHPYGRSIFFSQSSFLAGVAGGAFIARGDTKSFGWTLIFYYSSALLASVFLLLSSISVHQAWRVSDPGLWAVSVFGMASLLAFSFLRPAFAPWLWRLMAVLPLLNVAYGAARLDRLLYPYSWKDVRDRRLPPRMRGALLTVAVTAVLPLGALAVPFWIYARQRLWPRSWSAFAASPDHAAEPA